jgi:four helix bundle protein
MAFRKIDDIQAWRESRKLARMIYSQTRQGKVSRDFGFCDQIQRAAVSIMANIAEGFGSGSDTEFSRFLRYSRRSAFEVQSLIYTAADIGYLDEQSFTECLSKSKESSGW